MAQELNSIPCTICNQMIKMDEPTTWTFILDEDNNPKFVVHYQCYEAAQKIIEVPEDRSGDLLEMQSKINDLQLSLAEMSRKLDSAVDISSIIEYLETFIEQQGMMSHRAPKGSDYSRIASFRVNDATDILERIKALLPKKVRVEQD